MHFLYFMLAIVAFVKGDEKNYEPGWYQGAMGKTCNDKCSSIGLKCDADKQSTITTCDAVKDAFREAGYKCQKCYDSRDYAGSPFSRPKDGNDCFYLTPGGKKSVCDANELNNHAPLCYCAKDGCSVFDIDGYLTGCSEEFPALQKELAKTQKEMKEENARLEEKQKALAKQVDQEVARLDSLIEEINEKLDMMANLNAQELIDEVARLVYNEMQVNN